MSDHLSAEVLTAFVDGELPPGELAAAKAHTDECLACAKLAVNEWLLKAAVAKVGQRYEAPAALRERLAGQIARGDQEKDRRNSDRSQASRRMRGAWGEYAGWTAAAVMILALGGWGIVEYRVHGEDSARAERAAMVTEACDLHIAMLAANGPPQVISSDRHTVKPWFQGKLPFSFNIPEALPAGATLDGANLAYLHNRPVAQLLFSIGRHRVSVFVEERNGAGALHQLETSHAGFQVEAFETDELEVIAVSDVDAGRLEALASSLKDAQART
jgi:anti-sigma factor RsiW